MFFQKKIGSDSKKSISNVNKTSLKWNIVKNIKNSIKPRIREKRPKFYWFILLFWLAIIAVFWFKTLFNYLEWWGFSLSNIIVNNIVDLKKDENESINILLMWAWWWEHDWPNLTDTMILTSINVEKKSVAMLSIPRDFFVDYSSKYKWSRINEILRDMSWRFEYLWISEAVARDEARQILINTISEITWIDIPYYAQIDFKWFEKAVDAIWWIDIEVPFKIVDESYPDWNYWVEVFEIQKWNHHLSWSVALKYARSRHSTSDFDRASRQQQIINSFKQKVIEEEIYKSPFKLKTLIWIVTEHLETNFSFSEMLTLATLSKDFSGDSLYSAVLNDDWNTRWGFLATPPRVDYWWAFVLIPYGWESDYSRIQIFTDIIMNTRELTSISMEVRNATNRSWLASKTANRLTRYWFIVDSVWNSAVKLDETQMHVYTAKVNVEKLKEFWDHIFPNAGIKLVDRIWYYDETSTDVEILVGKDIRF